MVGETELGGFFWRLGVRSTVREDVAGAKSEIAGLEVAGQKTADSINILDAATGKNIKGLRTFGSVASMTGGSLMMLSMTMKDADGNISQTGKMFQAAGMTLTTFGMVANTLGPIIRAIGFAHTAIIPAIQGATAAKAASVAADQAMVASQTELTAVKTASAGITGALENAEAEASAVTLLNASAAQVEVNALREQTVAKLTVTGATIAETVVTGGATTATAVNTTGKVIATGATLALAGATITLAGAMTALAAATVIGAVIVAAYLLYTAWDKAQQGARELEKQLKSLSDEMSILGQVQKTQSYETGIFEDALKGMKDEADKTADKIKDLTDEIDNYKDAVEDASNVELDIKSAELDLKKYPAELRAANKAIAEAKTADERSLAKIARDELKVTHERELNNLDDLKAKQLADAAIIKSVEDKGGVAAIEDAKTTALKEQKTLNDEIITQEGELRKLKLEELATNQQLAILSFQEYFLKMNEAGKSLTQEQYDIFTKNPNSPAAQAMKLIPPTVKFDALKAEREATGGRGYLWGAPAGTPKEGDMVTTALLSGVTQRGFRDEGVPGATWDRQTGTYIIKVVGTVSNTDIDITPAINATLGGY